MNQPTHEPGTYQTRSMNSSVVAYLICKGARVTAVDDQGFLFSRNHADWLHEFHNGGIVCAKDFADAYTRTLGTIRKIRRERRERRAKAIFTPGANDILCGRIPDGYPQAELLKAVIEN